METTVAYSDPLPPIRGVDAGDDAKNAIKIHTALRSISPSMASDHRLWAYLTHGPYFGYCSSRWKFRSGDPESHIKTRWFFKRGIQRNAIGRLWWAGYLTHEPWVRDSALNQYQKPDPYHYTNIILNHQDLFQGLSERDFGKSMVVRIVVLDVLERHRSLAKLSYTVLITRFLLAVNLLMKHTDLETLPVKDLDSRLEAVCGKIQKSMTSSGTP